MFVYFLKLGIKWSLVSCRARVTVRNKEVSCSHKSIQGFLHGGGQLSLDKMVENRLGQQT